MLVFTFRTYEQIELIREAHPSVFVFSKLKEDLLEFQRLILQTKPKLILGIAKGPLTQFEFKAVNMFNLGKVSKLGPLDFTLFVPESEFKISLNPQHSFCNWTAYKVAEFLAAKGCNTQLIFMHVADADLKKVLHALKHW